MTSNPKSLPLVWEFDKGEWEAASQVMDPEMVDEPQETWCKEWCLKWRIRVTQDGRFNCDQSDSLLLHDMINSRRVRDTLESLQTKIDLAEDHLRGCRTLGDTKSTPITLLPADKYAK